MRVKSGLAEMLKGGVIMDVVDAEQAKIAEEAGAVAVMALERVPADIRVQGGVARMSDPEMIQRDPGGGLDPGDGEVPDRPLRRGADPPGARDRLHRRVRGADAGRPRAPREQVGLHGAVRLRRDEPRRGAAADRRGRGDDPHEGRGRHRRHRQRGHAHALASSAASGGCSRCAARSSTPRRRSCARRSSSCSGWPRTGSCRSSPSPPAGSQRPPTRRSACSSAPTASSSARGSSSRATPRSAPARSSRRRRTTSTPTCSRASRPASASRWSASRRPTLDPSELLETRGW